MSMKVLTDKTGFPLVTMEELGTFHILPITKFQFEMFISETNRYGDNWYSSILKLNPRISYKYFDEKNYERIFTTGVLPEEALDFARWLGEGFDLPTIDEWRGFYRLLKGDIRFESLTSNSNISARAFTELQKLKMFLSTPLKFTLMKDGLVEWVRRNDKYVGLGSPRNSFHPNAWNPLTDEVRVINITERLFYFGFRLIRR